MSKLQTYGGVALAILVTGLIGFIYGRYTTAVARSELETASLRLQLVEARSQVLDARVSLYLVNFGDASRHLAFARTPLSSAKATLADRSRDELAAKIDQAVVQIGAAQEQAARLNQDANSRAGEAARLLAEVIQGVGR
jgi:hypothetical protein